MQLQGGSAQSAIIRFNLFDSAKFDDQAHGQFINSYSSNTRVEFNTFYQPAANPSGRPGSLVAALSATGMQTTGAPNITGVIFSFNTCVGVGGKGHVPGGWALEHWVNWTNAELATSQNISPQADSNYVTSSGNSRAGGIFAYPFNSSVITPKLRDNFDMEAGKALPDFPKSKSK